MLQQRDIGRSTAAFAPDETLVVVVEMSRSTWLIAGLLPGVNRRPLKKLKPDENVLMRLLEGWRQEALAAGRTIARVVVAYEAGRDGFWLARWLRAHGIEAHVIHATSVTVSRDRRRAKTDRLDTALLMRVLLGWLRGEVGHCTMAAVPEISEEDAKRPTRERENLVAERTRLVNRMKAALARLGIRDVNPALRKTAGRLDTLRTAEGTKIPGNTLAEMRRDIARLRLVEDQIAEIERERLQRLAKLNPERSRAAAMVHMLSRVVGLGVETADMLAHEILLRDLRDRRAVARYAGLTGSPDDSGARRRERGLSRAGNARVRRGMVQLAWRFLVFQKESALVAWYRERTADGRTRTRMAMIVALARKLLIALWRMVKTGELPEGVRVRPHATAAAA
ncbi:IS110 family transposase [Sinorhizobium fredii]|uniref:IS110 family transposase n=5 Tax=Rhizobium fredii TaxID=380 RepID=A0A844AJM0_RHIFR|nr:IS110 family transposase [Sinorhizobium fredii]ASY72493.1 Mobile element protein [Sinorhizobium fredii CCBAU 83666]MQX12697.1 IS110 family transposase [Sinorhizobium fredii]UTY47273.1 IS110 family transposase [Sinorhizobium fredii]UTY47274.1 IS110 family transposase [Sinorhizobium fredii]UTY47310.1 IS110 family transposase [Sinorhizobium fredii]